MSNYCSFCFGEKIEEKLSFNYFGLIVRLCSKHHIMYARFTKTQIVDFLLKEEKAYKERKRLQRLEEENKKAERLTIWKQSKTLQKTLIGEEENE